MNMHIFFFLDKSRKYIYIYYTIFQDNDIKLQKNQINQKKLLFSSTFIKAFVYKLHKLVCNFNYECN